MGRGFDAATVRRRFQSVAGTHAAVQHVDAQCLRIGRRGKSVPIGVRCIMLRLLRQLPPDLREGQGL
jgi:hypothetical protein